MINIDLDAPIIPYEGLGGIKLYSTMGELREIIELYGIEKKMNSQWIRFDVQDGIELIFHAKNNKLFLMRALDRYRGTLFGKIGIGSSEEEVLAAEPSFVYDDFEEVWESPKGVYIETDGKTNLVRWISVFIKETHEEDFDEANW